MPSDDQPLGAAIASAGSIDGSNALSMETTHETPQIAALAHAALVDVEAARHELVAALGARGPADLALDHDGAQRLLGCVVGRLHFGVAEKAPQRRPQRVEVGAGGGRAAATSLRRAAFERSARAAATARTVRRWSCRARASETSRNPARAAAARCVRAHRRRLAIRRKSRSRCALHIWPCCASMNAYPAQ